MQNDKNLEITFIDYKFNKLKEELTLEMRRNISEKKINYEKQTKDHIENFKKLINTDPYNPNDNNNKINSGLKSIKEENFLNDFSNKNLMVDFSEDKFEQSKDYFDIVDEMGYTDRVQKYNLNEETDNFNYKIHERKLSGNNFYKHRSIKSISSTGRMTDDENLYAQ